jgi:hypothetical protein
MSMTFGPTSPRHLIICANNALAAPIRTLERTYTFVPVAIHTLQSMQSD